MKQLVVLCVGFGLALSAAACKQEVAANVVCKVVEGPAADCTITQTKGDAEMEVCWDFKVTCQNNSTLEAHGCAKVKDKGTVPLTIPVDKLKISGPCDTVKEATVSNMTIDGKATTKQ
jgi:hypothetical protein